MQKVVEFPSYDTRVCGVGNAVAYEVGGVIQKLTIHTQTVSLGQRVRSTRGELVPIGIHGTVVTLFEPYTEETTSNVIAVLWDGHHHPMRMKIEELKIILD